MKTLCKLVTKSLGTVALSVHFVLPVRPAEPGQLKWSFATGGPVHSSPAIGVDGTVYVASDDKLHALDNAAGALKWTADIGTGTSAPTIGPDGTLYVGGGYMLHALDGFTGSRKWSRAIDNWPLRLALGANATMYVSDELKLQALASGTGTPKWTMTVDPLSDGYLVNGPAIGFDDTVYVCSRTCDDGRYCPLPINSVRAVRGLSGNTKWVTKQVCDSYYTSGPSFPVIGGDGTVYVGSRADSSAHCRLFALDGATGAQKWVSVLAGLNMSTAVVGSDGTVFIFSGLPAPSGIEAGAFVEALNGATGAKRWTFETRCDELNSPALAADGTVYVCADTRLQALDGALGTLKWSFTAGGGLGSPAIGVDGTVYVGSKEGKIYALQGSAGLADSPWPKSQHDARNTGAAVVPVTGRPVIDTQPADGLSVEGSTASLWVQATGAPPLSFQWFFQDAPIPGATNSLLALANLQFSNAGIYYVEVRNPVGMATSRETRVRVGFGLTVTNKGVGTVAITPALAAYDPGSSVELRALPAAGRQLIQWSGDVTSSANPLTLTVNGHLTVVAEFSFLPGDMIWAFATGGEVRSTPAIGTDGTVYVGSGDKKVYALDGATGTLKWSFAMDWQITSSAALGADGTVYIASYALDGVTGRKLLAFESVGSPFGSSPALGTDGTVYAGSVLNGVVYALDGATGVRRWAANTAGVGCSAAAIAADGTVYHGMYSLATSPPTGRVYALDGATGAQRWFFAAGNSVLSSPAVGADGTVYFGSSDKKVFALNGATGVQRWAFISGGEVVSSAAVDAHGTVYIGSQDGNVYAVDGMSGVRKWAFATGGGVESSPAIAADGTVYVGSWDCRVYALDATTGAQKWAFTAGSGVGSSPAIGADGTVYIGSSEGKVYALKGSAGLANSPWPKMGADAQNTGRVAPSSPSAPQVTEQPASLRVAVGGEFLLSTSASGSQPLACQWHRNGQAIAGATEGFLRVANAALDKSGDYQLTVRNSLGAATSAVARVIVGYRLTLATNGVGSIQAQPAFEILEPGQTVVLTAIPGSGGTFVGWEGDASGQDNPLTLAMDGPKRVQADFSVHPGTLKWVFGTGGPVSSSPALATDGTVYVRSDDGKVYALDPTEGIQRWAVATGGAVTSSPAVGTDGTVYVGSSNKTVYALEGATGAQRWTFGANYPIKASPALGADGTVYIGSSGPDPAGGGKEVGSFYALNGTTGAQKWFLEANGGFMWSAAVGADGTVYVPSGKGGDTLYALDPATGAQKWSVGFGWVLSSPVLGADGTVYLAKMTYYEGGRYVGREIYALNGTTGTQRWRCGFCQWCTEPFEGPILGPDGVLYGVDYWTYAWDGATGTRKWSFNAGGQVASAPALASDGTLYVGSSDGKLYALNSGTGALKWAYATGSALRSSPALAEDGTVYVGAADGKLYAVAGAAGLARSPWPKFRHDAQNTGRSDVVPWVFEQPAWVVLKEDEAGQITVRLDVVPRPDFRWFRNGQPIPGPMQATFTIWSVTRADEGIYTVVASNAVGQATSEPIAVVVSNVKPLSFLGLKWEGGNVGPVNLETSAHLGALAAWHSIGNYPPSSGTQLYVETDPADAARFYRLNAPAALQFSHADWVNGWWLTQPAGTRVRIEMVSATTGWTNWQELATLTLPASPYLFADPESVGAPERVYRTTVVP